MKDPGNGAKETREGEKKLEREQEKERRKQEMDKKKRDREQKQQEKERAEKKRKCAGKLQQAPKSKYKCTTERVRQDIESDESQSDDSQSDDSQSEDSQSDRECVQESSRPSRKIRLPSRFRDSSDADSDDDAVLCDLCQAREPEGCKQVPYFWIDCNSCGKWVHTYCAFGRNNVTRQYLCEHCI